ncbi:MULTISPECIES: hypothetical protein [Microbacterium]|jgi:hypothetical protein|uniref:Uncharacterized protein n=1 Tax=Microbacterium galbinum TaxID=2851646 RepID=A0ABY4ILZ0_9MICO|nr:hypothetical protein [Microbacterium galbinum]MCK2024301.1 hypothetical protein [Microbacterium galbinum]MCK2031013.1 hypothetical protein [Microbacterium galbinum]UPL13315.1 hypothetical protein KV396_01990 [Microbacterium galbinum]
MRRSAVVPLIALVALLAGCTGTPIPASSATPAPTRTATTAPTSTATPAPSSSPSTAPAPSSPPVASDPTDGELVTMCVEKVDAYAGGATYASDRGTVEWLAEQTTWFVVVPTDRDGNEGAAVCGIEKTSAGPDVTTYGETIPSGVADQRAELLRGEHPHE